MMAAQGVERTTIRALYFRIMPFLIICYVVSFLDRVNVSFAALHMNQDLGFTATVYGTGAGIVSIGYFIFEVPSNLMLHKLGAKIWIARIMISWGIVSAGFAFIQGRDSFYVMRFLLGAAEAGFFPGIILYLTNLFPRRSLATAFAIFIIGLPVAVVIGAPLSTAILETTNGILGFRNWQWMFILEGFLAVICGIVALFVLIDDPANATFLNAEQREWLLRTLKSERREKEDVRRYNIVEALMNGKVLYLALTVSFSTIALLGITLWLPQIIKGFGALSNVESGLFSALPFLVAGVVMVVNARHADKKNELRFHVLIPAFIGAVGLIFTARSTSPAMGMVAICVATSGVLSANILFWNLPNLFLTGAAAAAGIAFMNSIGNLGGFVGPFVIGWAKDEFGSFAAAMYILATMIMLYGVSVFGFITVRKKIQSQTQNRSESRSSSDTPDMLASKSHHV